MGRPSEAKALRRRRRIAARPFAREYQRLAHQGRLRERGAKKVTGMVAYAAGKSETWTT